MKVVSLVLFVLALPMFCYGQRASQDISPAQLQTVIDFPLNQAVKQRETYKAPLKAAYDRQITITGKDCQAESKDGQQPYNVCMGQAGVQADKDFAAFYRNLQMLCHDQDHGNASNYLLGEAGASNSYNTTANYSFNPAPDIIAKIAFDPGFGHYELTRKSTRLNSSH